MENKTTMDGLQERQDAPLILTTSAEPLNATNPQTVRLHGGSMPVRHWGSGCYSQVGARMSGHSVFVVGFDGKPLTPTTNAKARKLLQSKQARPQWNKFGQFGIQMLVATRTETPQSALGVDFGTKFEGYVVVVGRENNQAVMWKLPDKKKIVHKLEERSQLRRAKRWRKCRMRECRFDNREKKGFIAPSQLVMVQSRLKALGEFFKCYPIKVVALEDVRFNHRDNKWGKNFSTIEIGKRVINDWIRERAYLQMYSGYETPDIRGEYGYKKSGQKSAELFNSHCSDALALAVDVTTKQRIPEGKLVVVDDTYRPVRRRLHDTQPSKGGVRQPYSQGNFKGVRKGTVCEHGQIVGGTKNNYWIRNTENKRIGRSHISWLSHKFKTKEVMVAIPPPNKFGGLLATRL